MSALWVTRTRPGATEFAQLAESRGWQCLVQPVLHIESISIEPSAVQAAMAPQLVIVLSGHAANAYTKSALWSLGRRARHVAIGARTGAVIRDQGGDVCLPEESVSEAILDMPEIRNLKASDHVWIIAGAQGRDLLQSELSRKVAHVVKFELYRRVDAHVTSLDVSEIDMIEAASAQALHCIWRLWLRHGGKSTVPLLVPSARLEQIALEIGFINVHNATSAAPAEMLACAETIGTA